MMRFDPRWPQLFPFVLLLAAPAGAQDVVAVEEAEGGGASSAPAGLSAAIAAASVDVLVYNDHVVTLASPFMEGRLPGTKGMEVAQDYVEYWLKDAGLEPAFDAVVLDAQGQPTPAEGKSWRQPFPLAGTLELVSQRLEVEGGERFVGGVDFGAMSAGSSGTARGELVFVGYSIQDGPDGYSTFAEGDDLTGKVALMLRFEPMGEDGKSKWSERAPWSDKAGFAGKLGALRARNPAAVIVANAPGAADERTNALVALTGGGDSMLSVPVFSMTHEAADRLVRAADPHGRTLLDLRKLADQSGGLVPMNAVVTASAELLSKPLIAENVGGLLRGRGELADQYVVIGAHLDHLGTGLFGSREGAGNLHPGADDNASGSAAVLMLADKLVQAYAALPEGAPARTVLLMLFSAEESGLNGSQHYASHPIVPADKHALMINFDMIGRIRERRLSVAGAATGEGMKEWLAPFLEASPLEIVQPESMSAASDHTPFYQAGIPVLFAIIADFHDDYHTPRDVSALINREDAVHTIDLFEDIALAAATRAEPFVYKRVERARGARVRFGARPGTDAVGGSGVLVGPVTPGGSAAEAGILEGDRLTQWNGEPIADQQAWRAALAKHAPGDKVQVTLERDGAELVLEVTLQGRDGAGG